MLIQEGVEHFDNQRKHQLATEYFSALLGQPSPSLPNVQLSHIYELADLSCLKMEFTWEEIVDAINHSPNNRSPSPDGFTNEFYKAFHSVIKTDLQFFFAQLYQNQVDLSSINLAHISLLPKKETPLELKDFRPISIVHNVPKLASKVLSRRLQL